MTQQDALEFFEDNKIGKFTSKQVSEKLGISPGSAATNLKKLRKVNLINFEKDKSPISGNVKYLYWYKEE